MPAAIRLGYEHAGTCRFGDAAIQTSIPSAPPPAAPPLAAAPVRRLAVIDFARGVALLAMALYHLTWDLGFLRLTPENAALSSVGKASAHGIAGSFLVLVGISLVWQGAGEPGGGALPGAPRSHRPGGGRHLARHLLPVP